MNLTTQVGICKAALALLGEKCDLTTITSGAQKVTDLIAATYDLQREYLLSIFPWNFSQKRAELDYIVATISAATNADPVVLTLGAVTAFANKDLVQISNVVGMTDLNNQYYMIDNVNTTSKTFELFNTDPTEQSTVAGTDTLNTHESIAGTSFGTYGSGGQMRLVPKSGYEYAYALPSDCLAVTTLMDESGPVDYPYEVSVDRLFTNLPDAFIEYSYQTTDDSTPIFHGTFINCFVRLLAATWAWPLRADKDLAKVMNDQYERAFSAATANDANQSNRDYTRPDSFITARGNVQVQNPNYLSGSYWRR